MRFTIVRFNDNKIEQFPSILEMNIEDFESCEIHLLQDTVKEKVANLLQVLGYDTTNIEIEFPTFKVLDGGIILSVATINGLR